MDPVSDELAKSSLSELQMTTESVVDELRTSPISQLHEANLSTEDLRHRFDFIKTLHNCYRDKFRNDQIAISESHPSLITSDYNLTFLTLISIWKKIIQCELDRNILEMAWNYNDFYVFMDFLVYSMLHEFPVHIRYSSSRTWRSLIRRHAVILKTYPFFVNKILEDEFRQNGLITTTLPNDERPKLLCYILNLFHSCGGFQVIAHYIQHPDKFCQTSDVVFRSFVCHIGLMDQKIVINKFGPIVKQQTFSLMESCVPTNPYTLTLVVETLTLVLINDDAEFVDIAVSAFTKIIITYIQQITSPDARQSWTGLIKGMSLLFLEAKNQMTVNAKTLCRLAYSVYISGLVQFWINPTQEFHKLWINSDSSVISYLLFEILSLLVVSDKVEMIDMMFRYGQNSVMYMDGILKLVLNNFKISKSALRRIMKDLFMLGTKFSKVTIHLLSIVGTLPDKRQQLIVSTLVDWITTFFYDNLDALNPLIVKRHDTITAFTDFISSFFELQLSRPIFSNAFHTFASSIISTIKIPKYEIFGCIILQNFLDLEYKYRDHIKGLIDEFIDDTYANIPDNLERILCSITPKNEYLYQTPTLRLKSIQDIVFGIIFVLRSKFLTKINTYTAIAIWQALRNYATEAELEYTITLFTKLLDHELLNVDFIPRIFKILVTQDGSLYLYHRATQDFHWKVSKALIKLNSMFLDNEMYKKALYSDDSHLPACWELITKSFDLELVEIGMECIRQFYQLSIPKELEEKSDQIAFKFAVDLKNAIAEVIKQFDTSPQLHCTALNCYCLTKYQWEAICHHSLTKSKLNKILVLINDTLLYESLNINSRKSMTFPTTNGNSRFDYPLRCKIMLEEFDTNVLMMLPRNIKFYQLIQYIKLMWRTNDVRLFDSQGDIPKEEYNTCVFALNSHELCAEITTQYSPVTTTISESNIPEIPESVNFLYDFATIAWRNQTCLSGTIVSLIYYCKDDKIKRLARLIFYWMPTSNRLILKLSKAMTEIINTNEVDRNKLQQLSLPLYLLFTEFRLDFNYYQNQIQTIKAIYNLLFPKKQDDITIFQRAYSIAKGFVLCGGIGVLISILEVNNGPSICHFDDVVIIVAYILSIIRKLISPYLFFDSEVINDDMLDFDKNDNEICTTAKSLDRIHKTLFYVPSGDFDIKTLIKFGFYGFLCILDKSEVERILSFELKILSLSFQNRLTCLPLDYSDMLLSDIQLGCMAENIDNQIIDMQRCFELLSIKTIATIFDIFPCTMDILSNKHVQSLLRLIINFELGGPSEILRNSLTHLFIKFEKYRILLLRLVFFDSDEFITNRYVVKSKKRRFSGSIDELRYYFTSMAIRRFCDTDPSRSQIINFAYKYIDQLPSYCELKHQTDGCEIEYTTQKIKLILKLLSLRVCTFRIHEFPSSYGNVNYQVFLDTVVNKIAFPFKCLSYENTCLPEYQICKICTDRNVQHCVLLLLHSIVQSRKRSIAFAAISALSKGLHFQMKYFVQSPEIRKAQSNEDVLSTLTQTDNAVEPGKNSYRGIINTGAMCFINSVFQLLYSIPSLVDRFVNTTDSGEINDFTMLKRVFASLTENTIDAYNPKEFLQNFKMHGDLSLNAIGQQDAMEFFNFLIDKTDNCLQALGKPRIMDSFFKIITQERFICHKCENVKIQENFTTYLIIPMTSNSLEDELKKMFNSLTVHDLNLSCTKCQSQQFHSHIQFMKEYPPYLIFNISRFKFDVGINAYIKSTEPFKLPANLNLSDYALEQNSHFDKMSYNIIGCIGHIGEISFGHYVATCKNLRGYPRQWFYLNDDCVCSTKASDATLVRYFENPLSCSMYEYESGSKREPSYAYIVLYESEYERKKRDIKLPINYDSNELQSEIELFVQNQAQCELYNIYNEMPPSPITSIQSFNRSRSLSRSSSIRTFCSNASDSSTVKVNVKNSDHLLNDADTKIINFKVNTSSSVMDMYFDVLKSNDYYQFLASISNVIRMNWSDDIPIVLTGLHIALQWFFVSIKFIPSHITNSFMLLISSISWAKLNEELIVEQIRLSTMTDPNIFMQCLSVPNRIRRELLIMFFFEIVLGPNIDKMPHLPCTHALFEMSIIFLNELVDYGKTIFIQYLSKLELFIKTSYKNLLYFYNHGIIYLLSQLLYKKDLAIDSGKRQHSLRPIFTNKENDNNNWIALSVQEVISMIILNINLEYYGCQNIEAFQSNYICFKDKPLLPLLSEVRVYLSGSINSSFFTMLEYLILSCSNDKLENTITIRLATVLCASSAHMSIKMCDLFSNIIAYCYHRDDANFVETIKYIAHQDKFTDFRFYRIFYMEEIGSISKLGLLTTIKTSREIYKHCISIHCIWNLLLANSNVTDYINSEADVLLATSKKISSEIQGFEYDDNTLITIHKALAYISQIISMIRNDS